MQSISDFFNRDRFDFYGEQKYFHKRQTLSKNICPLGITDKRGGGHNIFLYLKKA